MNKWIRSYFTKTLENRSRLITVMTHRRDLTSMITTLYPMKTDKELIRLGPSGDGGYLTPNDLQDIRYCFSAGVGNIVGFERDCANLGMDVYLADKSVDGPNIEHPKFHFKKKYIGAISNDDFITLEEWVASVVNTGNSDL